MKKCVSAAFAAMVFSALAGVPEKIKAKWFEADISPEVGALIAARKRAAFGATAPADRLYLNHVDYGSEV